MAMHSGSGKDSEALQFILMLSPSIILVFNLWTKELSTRDVYRRAIQTVDSVAFSNLKQYI
jgi:hypothetical protein